MEDNLFYNEVITDHNLHPIHKHPLETATHTMEGVNPNCGDDISLQIDIEDGVIKDGAFVGDGCAISQASADIMLELIIGKTVDEGKRYAEMFFRMIHGEATEKEVDELEEAGVLEDISRNPTKTRCAVLGWHTLEEMLKEL